MTTRFQRFAIFGLVLLFAALALIVLLPTAAHAQEVFTPSAADLTIWASTPGLDETAPAPVSPPVPSPILPAVQDDTVDQLFTLVLTLTRDFTSLVQLSVTATTILTALAVLGWILSKFTPTKKDDEFFERFFNALRGGQTKLPDGSVLTISATVIPPDERDKVAAPDDVE